MKGILSVSVTPRATAYILTFGVQIAFLEEFDHACNA